MKTQLAIRKFLDNRRAQNLKPKSIAWYEAELKRFAGVYPELPTEPEPVEEFLTNIEGVPETKHAYYRALKAFYRFLKRRHGSTDVKCRKVMQGDAKCLTLKGLLCPKSKEKEVLSMTTQLDLFGEAKVAVAEPEPMTEVRLGRHSVRIPLRKKRREALTRLMDVLKELEGKDIYIGSYDIGGRHYRVDNLLLRRLQLQYHPFRFKDAIDYIPSVVVLWGSRGGQVRIFTDYLVAVREQEYQGYTHWLLDFRNGFYDSKLDEWKSHYACLTITRFKD